MKRPSLALLIAVSLSATIAGCSEDLRVLPIAPAPEYPASSVRFVCGSWSPGAPAPQRALFDIHYGLRSASDSNTGPSPWQLDEVREHGGTIVHEFHVPMVRVLIDVAAIPRLSAWSFGVPDPTAHPVPVVVKFVSAMTEEDIARIVALGGTDLRPSIQPSIAPWIGATVPDSAVPALRADPRVEYVAMSGLLCVGTSPIRRDHPPADASSALR